MPRGPRVNDQRLPKRFWVKVEANKSGCWDWTACKIKGGYGMIGWHGKVVLAHRLAYQVLDSPIPSGLELDHLCRNTSCVNPAHLEPVTHKENIRRGAWAIHARGATYCRHGHALEGDGTLVDSEGQKRCLRCYVDGWQRRNALKKEKRHAARA